MAPPNGCALCERKESSQWHKNTDTERDICAACYQNQRYRNGTTERVCSVREEGVHNGTKIQIRAKEIFVIRATINNNVRHDGVLYLYGTGAQIQRRAK